MDQLLDMKPGDECRLEGGVRARWDGEAFIPKGGCNTVYVLTDLDSGARIELMAEAYAVKVPKVPIDYPLDTDTYSGPTC